MQLPKLYRIRRTLNPPVVADVAAEVRAAIRKPPLAGRLKPGGRVAVTGGSRGVANIATILRATCDTLKGLGASPFLARDLTARSGGNSVGIGLADFATRRLADKVDVRATYTNVLTASNAKPAMLPVIFETDREATEHGLQAIGLTAPQDAKVARIRNTLALDVLQVSEALLPEVRGRADLTILDGPFEFQFTESGDLVGEVA